MAKITLVDDDENIVTSVSMALESHGHSVSSYNDGLSGLQAVKDAWAEFNKATNGSALTLTGDFLRLLAAVLPSLAPVANVTADAVGGLLDNISDWVKSGGVDRIADFIVKTAPDMIKSLGGKAAADAGLLVARPDVEAQRWRKGEGEPSLRLRSPKPKPVFSGERGVREREDAAFTSMFPVRCG